MLARSWQAMADGVARLFQEDFDLDGLRTTFEGPVGDWFIVMGFVFAALVIAMLVHRAFMALVKRITLHKPFAHDAVLATSRTTHIILSLLAVRAVLGGAPSDLPFLTPVAYAVTVTLIITLTCFTIQFVHSVGDTMVRLHPHDVTDNLKARQVLTQTRVLVRSLSFVLAIIGLSFVLLTLPGARQFGASLLASAGVAGLVAGIAARPVLGNFIAGLQIAFSQPIRIDDVLIVQGEWGRVEEITGTFVVVRIWDERRLIVPLQWFIENPFENWTHRSSSILGTVFLWLDFGVDTQAVREAFERYCKASPLWDGRVCVMHVTETTERAMQVRLLISAKDSGTAFDLRAAIREHMIEFISEHFPEGLPRLRAEMDRPHARATHPAEPPLGTRASQPPKGAHGASSTPAHSTGAPGLGPEPVRG